MKEINIKALSKLITSVLQIVLKNNFVALYIYDKSNNQYFLSELEGVYDRLPKNILEDHPAIVKMYRKEEPVFHILHDTLNNDALDESYLFVPSIVDNIMICFLIMGKNNLNTPYNSTDIQNFAFISRQIAPAVKSALSMEENKIIQEREFQAEKLAFIGGMAEGVAHRIKNRLNHFSLATAGIKVELNNLINDHPDIIKKNPDIKKTIDSLKEIGESLIDNVIRTDQVIQGIINYAHAEETENFFSKIFFDEIITGSIDLVRIKHDIDKIPLEVHIETSNIIYGIKPQLIECIYNLLDNSFDAIDEKIKFHINHHDGNNYTPRIDLYLKHNEDFYFIEARDNGIGINDEDKNKIFAPFFTTKTSYKSKAFSGYGLYIVKRMIEENHKGKIWFDSTYMEKTSFYIHLPRYK